MELSTIRNCQFGTEIALRFFPPIGVPLAAVQINHGLAEHSARYQRFAMALAHEGFCVYAHDHRGHGHTTAPDSSTGIFSTNYDGAEKVLSDVSAVCDHIEQDYAGLPIICFGHSMGGLIAMNFALANADRLAGVAVWNSNFTTGLLGNAGRAVLAYEKMRLGSDVPSRILPKLTFQAWGKGIDSAKTPFDWLSHHDNEVRAYIDDPLCGWDASVSMWQDIFKLVFAGAAVASASNAAKALPAFLLGGGEDPATDGGKAVAAQSKRMKAAGFSAVKYTLYPDARHETLNDDVAPQATAEFIDWLRSIL